MITRQLHSGGAFWTNYPSGRQTTQSSQRQRWRVPAPRDLGVSHIARRRDLELMGHPRARAARRPICSTATHREIPSRWGSSQPRRNWPPRPRALAASPAGNGPSLASCADENCSGPEAHRERRLGSHTHRGSHRQYRHPTKPGVVTVAGKPRGELHPKTLASILRQAGLKNETGGIDESPKGGQA
jgi:predicted RNA binding protein YcfA (HicA-like mRNA interferase family)